MKIKWLISFFIVASLFSSYSYAQENLTATEIIKKANDKIRGETNTSTMKMVIIRPTWQRSISMKSWGKGKDYSLTYITSPANEKGQVFMKLKTEIWNWIPTIGRMIKIPASMMSQGWMGSDYTNDDILKESSIVVDYTHKIIGEEEVNGYKTYKIEMLPKDNAAVVWGKVFKWITKNEYIQIKTEYYDEDSELVKTELGSNFKVMDDRFIPSKIEIIPANDEGKKTVLFIESAKFNIALPSNFFSQQNMKRVR
jgi:outer membrane lipoprotein-sorting protein